MAGTKKTPPQSDGASNSTPKSSPSSYEWMRAVEAVQVGDMRAKLIAHTIARSVGPDGTTTYLSTDDLCRVAECSSTELRRSMRRLKAAGIVRSTPRNGPDGRLRHNLYELLVVPLDEDGSPVARGEDVGTPAARSVAVGPADPSGQNGKPSGPNDLAQRPESGTPAANLRAGDHLDDHLLDHHEDHRAPARATAERKAPPAALRKRPGSAAARAELAHRTPAATPRVTGGLSDDERAVVSTIPPRDLTGDAVMWREGFRFERRRLVAWPDWYPAARYGLTAPDLTTITTK